MTKLCLAISGGELKEEILFQELSKSKYILTSFYYFKDKLPFEVDLHLVDSGAFTFFSSKKKIDIDKYLTDYIAYINKYDIKHFFELDIDVIVGYDKVLELRERLERETGKKCIPVWHMSRGKYEFIKMIKEYDYASIGGVVSGENIKNHKDKFHLLNKLANQHGCKLHGLGVTDNSVDNYGFYSVDSTSWSTGRRFAKTYMFDGTKMKTIQRKENTRLIDYKKLDVINIKEWLKFQKYLARNKR